MVMRCVLKHHVCLCVLSTAVLAGLALITAQTKVYAGSLNCDGIVNTYGTGVPGNPSGDNPNKRIECDGDGRYEGEYGKGNGGRAVITIVDELKITDNGKRNTNPAIQVERQGKLTLAGEVSIQNVNKGILVKDSKSSVIVTQGKIGVRGDYVIGVKDGGTVTLMGEVKVNSVGIVFMGDKGTANVSGGAGGATISLANGNSTGVIMQGKGGANATVINMTITGSGGVGAEMMGEGTLMLNMVKISQVQMGARVSKGKLTVMGGEIKANGAGGIGADVSGGVLEVMGNVTIMGTTMGLRVAGTGSATMVGGKIQGGGSGGYGVIVESSGNVTLSGGVEISGFKMGGLCEGGDV
ncbi:hypothetical protein m07a_11200 [Bartonella schoenbuchensis m07a]|uniref:Right handed beta helix domain-containing protein n=2 Tax=Bartonella schoenbuchensis TaxID=165694 RepID=N6UJX0_9HYPH|nr:hypothetical protein m07a_11200 [Bartonella schoenbuchensis m07a]